MDIVYDTCVSGGWSQQPQLAESDWTLGLGVAAHLWLVDQSVCTDWARPPRADLLDGSGAPGPVQNQTLTLTPPPCVLGQERSPRSCGAATMLLCSMDICSINITTC